MINWREAVVAEAYTWLGTPYHHCADVKGHGVDCAMILVRIYCDLGIAPRFDPRPYSPHWFIHRDEELYLDWIRKYADQVEVPQAGDIRLFKFGRTAAHGAIVVSDELMIHAYQPSGVVELVEMRALEARYHSTWSPRR